MFEFTNILGESDSALSPYSVGWSVVQFTKKGVCFSFERQSST
jgi:hypothetical protein